MKKQVPMLRPSKFFYEDKEELIAKIAELKKMMGEHAKSLNGVMATATAYNIVKLYRTLEEMEHKETCAKKENSVKFRIRNHAISAISGTGDPVEALKKILKELG